MSSDRNNERIGCYFARDLRGRWVCQRANVEPTLDPETVRREGLTFVWNDDAIQPHPAPGFTRKEVEAAEFALHNLHQTVGDYFDPPLGRKRVWPGSIYLAHRKAGEALRTLDGGRDGS